MVVVLTCLNTDYQTKRSEVSNVFRGRAEASKRSDAGRVSGTAARGTYYICRDSIYGTKYLGTYMYVLYIPRYLLPIRLGKFIGTYLLEVPTTS